MSSRRLAPLLGSVIALLLIGGVVAVVLDGSDDGGETDFAQEPSDIDGTAEPGAGMGLEPSATPSEPETPSPDPQAAPTEDGMADQVAVADPTALTGGWEGGTPNTGTAVSAAGLLLLTIGGGLLWLRRART